tara:strand:- start:114 stop:635 length:522 start_codon:yes stop_codon:yes gene_type:complete
MFKQPFQEGGPVNEPEIDQSGIALLYPATDERKFFKDERESDEPIIENAPYVPGYQSGDNTQSNLNEIDRIHKEIFGTTDKRYGGFGATRENVGEQLEAFRNAPVHVDPPNIGFFGEKIPAPLFDRAMKYLDSLPPSERVVIEEMIRKNIMKKRQQQLNDINEVYETYGYLDA